MRCATLLIALVASAPALAVDAASPVRGVVRALRDATLATDLNSRVIRLPFREGEAFAKGDTLVEFDCEKPKAEMRAAEAEEQVNQIAYDNAQQLDRRQAIGRMEVQAAKARRDKARAAFEALQARVRDCKIAAPFSGRIVDMRIREHEMSTPGQPLLRAVDAGSLEIELIVPSTWLAWLKVGAPVRISVDETGRSYPARVARTAAAVDPVSQTIKISALFAPGDTSAVLPGMSLDATFDPLVN